MSPTFKYNLISTGNSSNKYGNCEICNKPATEIFHQIEKIIVSGGEVHNKDLFGHKKCLVKERGVIEWMIG